MTGGNVARGLPRTTQPAAPAAVVASASVTSIMGRVSRVGRVGRAALVSTVASVGAALAVERVGEAWHSRTDRAGSFCGAVSTAVSTAGLTVGWLDGAGSGISVSTLRHDRLRGGPGERRLADSIS